jgi:uncharacterized RDD family membrane protein YckC
VDHSSVVRSSVDREQFRISGLTGVDVALDIAGVGSRSYAFIIDWHIRLLLTLGWFCGVWLLIRVSREGLPSMDATPRVLWTIAVGPALAIYLLYHPVLEVLMRGRTPGKRRAGVRIVTRQGGTPSLGALLIRNIFRLVDSLPFFYLVGLAGCFITQQRVRIGDLAAGTLLVLDSESAASTLAQLGSMVALSGLPPALVELIHDLLERWPVLDVGRRDELARSILARADPAADAAALARLTDADLSRRLRQLLAGVRPEGT